MKTAFLKSFTKDLKTHERDTKFLARVKEIIMEVEAVESIFAIKNMKKLKKKRLPDRAAALPAFGPATGRLTAFIRSRNLSR